MNNLYVLKICKQGYCYKHQLLLSTLQTQQNFAITIDALPVVNKNDDKEPFKYYLINMERVSLFDTNSSKQIVTNNQLTVLIL